jgi:hypothetical protein
MTRQLVYGYEVVRFWDAIGEVSGHTSDGCWYVAAYPHHHWYSHEDAWESEWEAPATTYLGANFVHACTPAGDPVPNSIYPCTGPLNPDTCTWDPTFIPMNGWGRYASSMRTVGAQLEPTYSDFSNCTYSVSNCLESATEDYGVHAEWTGGLTFIKHWPTDEEQSVLLHFDSLFYWQAPWPFNLAGSDPAKITFWGQPGIYYATNSWGLTNIAFRVKIKTNTRYTISENDFTFPGDDGMETHVWPNAQVNVTIHDSVQMLTFYGLGNCHFDLWGRSFTCPGPNVTFTLNVTPAGTKAKWQIVDDSDTSGGASVDENTGVIRPGPDPGAFTVKAARLDDPIASIHS